MIRILLAVVAAFTAFITLAITIFVAYSVAGPFFTALGGTEHAAIGGVSGDSAINFGGAIVFFAMSMISIPVALLLYLHFSRRQAQPRAAPVRRGP